MSNNSKNQKFQEKELSFYFAVLASIFISLIIILIITLVAHYVKNMSDESSTRINKFNTSLADLMQKSYSTDSAANNYIQLNTIAKNLSENKVLAYAYVVDSQNRSIIWSVNKADVGKQEAIVMLSYIDGASSMPETQEIVRAASGYIMKFGFSTDEVQRNELSSLLKNIRILIFVFFTIGLMASVLMGKMFQKPFDKLISGIKDFGSGNFDRRLEKTPFKEINQLIDSYNFMAFQLNELYQSLESKVQERTIELEQANIQLKEAQSMMVHSEKMRSLGELVAGIAHEINNPINFIHGNIIHLEKYSKDLLSLIEKYNELEKDIDPQKLSDISNFKDEIELDFIQDDIGELIKSCKEGTERTKNIVLDLKNFSRLEEMVFTELDIPKEIDTTLNILNNKVKNKAKLNKNYAENLPKIDAYGGQLNQVFMNILDNAIYAIKDEGEVTINVFEIKEEKRVVVEFKDNGIGISEENIKKVFDPFYTTKPVGEGTGLGMSIAYKVITNHGGTMQIESEMGKGTTIRIILPISQEKGKNG